MKPRYPNLRLYKLDQEGTQRYIRKYLNERDIEFLESGGNIFSVRYPERPLFVAHMDTVGEEHVSKKLLFKSGILQRRGKYVLGADDKAGIDILLGHIDDINFCFTVDEEIGCLGARHLRTSETFLSAIEKVPCAIEYDRRNNADLISYCGTDLIDEIEYCTHYKEASGLFTDITEWEDFIPAVNLSCGYYSAHTGKEFLHIEQWQQAYATLPALNKLRGPYEVVPPLPISKYRDYDWDNLYPGDFYNYSNPWSEKEVRICEHCHAEESYGLDFYEASGYDVLCSNCLEVMYGVKKI